MPSWRRAIVGAAVVLTGLVSATSPAWSEEETAAASAYYSVELLWAQSELFRASAEASQAPMGQLESVTRQLDRALVNYELGLDLASGGLEEAALEEAEELLRSWSQQFREDHAEAQQFITELGEAYADLLGGATAAAAGEVATERGLSSLPECSAQGMMAMLQRTSCSGDDLTPLLAQKLDADEALRTAAQELWARSWPALTVPAEQRPALGAGAQLRLPVLMAALPEAQERLTQAQQRYDAAAQELEASWAAAEASQREELSNQLRQLKAERRAARQAIGGVVLARLAAKSQGSWSPCLQDPIIGGCDGEDRTNEAIDLLREDRRLRRALERL